MRTEKQNLREEISELETKLRDLRRKQRQRKSERIGTVIRKGRGSRDRDEELKRARGYTDPGSYVRRDGSERLAGADWLMRKDELRSRSGGRCEHEQPWKVWPLGGPMLERCFNPATIPAHVKPRHPRRDDRMTNLMHYCPEHDKLMEKQAWRRTRFGERIKTLQS